MQPCTRFGMFQLFHLQFSGFRRTSYLYRQILPVSTNPLQYNISLSRPEQKVRDEHSLCLRCISHQVHITHDTFNLCFIQRQVPSCIQFVIITRMCLHHRRIDENQTLHFSDTPCFKFKYPSIGYQQCGSPLGCTNDAMQFSKQYGIPPLRNASFHFAGQKYVLELCSILDWYSLSFYHVSL